MAFIATRSFHDWHLALNHLNSNSLKRLASMVHGMNFKDTIHNDCIACMTGKAKRGKHPTSYNNPTRIGELIQGDWVDMKTVGLNGETVSLHLLDHKSSKSFVYQLRSKADIQKTLQEFLEYVETHCDGKRVKTLLLDQGSNFTSNEISSYCSEKGINLQFAPVDTPQAIGATERLHQNFIL
jgi:transposase InsO family protein